MCPSSSTPSFPDFSAYKSPTTEAQAARLEKALTSIAAMASVPFEAAHRAWVIGVLRLGDHNGIPCWSLGTQGGTPAIALRLDARKWQHTGRQEWFSPDGAHHLLGRQFIRPSHHCGVEVRYILTPGGWRSYLAACEGWFQSEGGATIHIPLTFLGRSGTFDSGTLAGLAGRRVTIILSTDADQTRYSRQWAKELQTAGAIVEPYFLREQKNPEQPLYIHIMNLVERTAAASTRLTPDTAPSSTVEEPAETPVTRLVP